MTPEHRALAQPEPEGLIAEQEAIEAYDFAYRKSAGLEHYGFGTLGCTENHRAGVRAILARCGRPAVKPVPVPVSERPWEREKGWNDLDGECWWCPPDGPLYWQMANPAMVYGGWLLPAHALPVPEVTPCPNPQSTTTPPR